ncbi:unnamed protein product [Symbiodinium natans]|uniref:Uncharacterized protein n=1 Tax=Symbiodinium natans TaxID=878477 RepID=A0A812IH01_9DINO|nr:unnamed protein product [Symbiodinium natans]
MTRFGGMLQLEDLRRHGESDGHIRSLEKLGQPAASPGGSEEDKAVPTPAQVRLALEVLRMPSSAQGRSYEARCELAGRADCRNFPAGRSCATEHARIIRTVAEVYTVDGEKAEGLAGRFAAATGSDGSGSPPAACTSLAAKVLTPSNIRLLALTTEWLSLVSPFVHEYDRGAAKSESAPTSSTARISNCSRLCENLKQDAVDSLVRMLRSNELLLGFTQDLNRTFAFKSLDGSTAQRPLVLNSNYTSGYLQIAEQQMKALSSSSDIAVYQDGRLLFHYEGVPDEEYAALLAPELGSIKNVSDLFLESVETWHQAGVGSALSPFDVVWWTANRSDSTLPEVLDPLAKLLQLDTHVLREEYLVARPTAVFLARSERAYWPMTMQRFDRLKSLKVRFMLAIFDATSEIETSFSTLRLFSGSIKASMSEENRNCYLKVFCDCPDLDKVVFFSKGNYQPSSLGFKILDKYRKLYGGQGRNTRRDRLPRKSFCSRLKSKGLASFQRQRDAQRRSLQQPDAEEGLEDLQQVVDSAARRRASPKQEKLRAILQAKAAELKQDFVHGPGHGIAAKLSEHERNVLKDKEKLQRIEMRQLHEQLEELAPGPCTFVILGSCVHLKTRAKKQLARVSSFAGSVFYSASEFLNGVSQEVAMDCKRLVWVCVEPETFQKVLGPQNGVEIPAADAQGECWKEVSIILATRVLGGYVASGQWPSLLANRQDASVPSPIIRLGAAYAQPHNIYMSKLPEKLKGCLNHLDAILRGGPEQGHVRWVLRGSKKEPRKTALIPVWKDAASKQKRFTVGLLLEVWVLAMSRRRSGAKKPEADAAGAMPAPAEPDAWRELRQCVDRLKQSKMWVESGAEPLPVSGVTALAADWRGSDIPQDALNPQGCGVLGDLQWSCPGPAGAGVGLRDISASREFWYKGDNPPELPETMVLFTDDSARLGFNVSGLEFQPCTPNNVSGLGFQPCTPNHCRGDLTPVSRVVQLAAFIFEWDAAVAAGEERAKLFAARAAAAGRKGLGLLHEGCF